MAMFLTPLLLCIDHASKATLPAALHLALRIELHSMPRGEVPMQRD